MVKYKYCPGLSTGKGRAVKNSEKGIQKQGVWYRVEV